MNIVNKKYLIFHTEKNYIPEKYVLEAETVQECLFYRQDRKGERRNTVQNAYRTKVETYYPANEIVGFVCLKIPEEGCKDGRRNRA